MTGRGNVGVLSLRLTRLRVVVLVACLAAFAVTFAQPAAADSGSGSTTTAASDPSTTSSTGTADSTHDGSFLDVHAVRLRPRPIRLLSPQPIRRRLRPDSPGRQLPRRPTDPSATDSSTTTDPATTSTTPSSTTDPAATTPARATRARPSRRHQTRRSSPTRRRRLRPRRPRRPRRHHRDRHDDGRDGADHHRQPPGRSFGARRRLSMPPSTPTTPAASTPVLETLVVSKTAKPPLVVHRKAAAQAQFVRLVPTVVIPPSTVHIPPTQLPSTQLAPVTPSPGDSISSDYVTVVSPTDARAGAAATSTDSTPAPKSPALPPLPPDKPAVFGSVGSAVGGAGGVSLFAAALVALLAFIFPSLATSRVATANAVPRAYRHRLSLERPG